MPSVPDTGLHVAWCDVAAARHACTTWHYSRCMPSGKLLHLGAWEDGRFIGAVIFGRGANNRLAGRFGLQQTECCELVRIALRAHRAPVSRIAAVALRLMRKQSPGLRCVVSYADPMQDHHGGVYQAMGWAYLGNSQPQSQMLVNGQPMHKRSCAARYGTASLAKLEAMGVKDARRDDVRWKHTYALGLDAEMRAALDRQRKPYPKRVKQATTGHPPDGGGAAPTHALQI